MHTPFAMPPKDDEVRRHFHISAEQFNNNKFNKQARCRACVEDAVNYISAREASAAASYSAVPIANATGPVVVRPMDEILAEGERE
jgi:hypothetical protein